MGIEITFDDHLVKEQAHLDKKNIDFKLLPYWDFFEGVKPWFWTKIGSFLFVLFLTK